MFIIRLFGKSLSIAEIAPSPVSAKKGIESLHADFIDESDQCLVLLVCRPNCLKRSSRFWKPGAMLPWLQSNSTSTSRVCRNGWLYYSDRDRSSIGPGSSDRKALDAYGGRGTHPPSRQRSNATLRSIPSPNRQQRRRCCPISQSRAGWRPLSISCCRQSNGSANSIRTGDCQSARRRAKPECKGSPRAFMI